LKEEVVALSKSIFKGLVNLVYPLSCQVCKSPLEAENDRYLCEACWEKIRHNPPPFCGKCGRSLPAGDVTSICGGCKENNYHFNRAGAPCLYEGVVKECIHLLKYGRKLCLVGALSKLMIEFMRSHFGLNDFDLIVPVPLHGVKLREREFNQAELLARQIKARFDIPISSNNLKKVKSGPPQTTLSRRERLSNPKGAFKVRRPSSFRRKSILLVDDVFTTGSTANECSRALLEAGAKKVDVLTLARGA